MVAEAVAPPNNQIAVGDIVKCKPVVGFLCDFPPKDYTGKTGRVTSTFMRGEHTAYVVYPCDEDFEDGLNGEFCLAWGYEIVKA